MCTIECGAGVLIIPILWLKKSRFLEAKPPAQCVTGIQDGSQDLNTSHLTPNLHRSPQTRTTASCWLPFPLGSTAGRLTDLPWRCQLSPWSAVARDGHPPRCLQLFIMHQKEL